MNKKAQIDFGDSRTIYAAALAVVAFLIMSAMMFKMPTWANYPFAWKIIIAVLTPIASFFVALFMFNK